MKNKLNEELNNIKYLFEYQRGRVISEQDKFDDEEYKDRSMYDPYYGDDDEEEFVNYDDMELDEEWNEEEEEDFNYLKDETFENREIETPVRPGIKTPTKPKKPGTPYKPKPGPKKNPKARKGDMPTWLSFDELGINLK